MSTAIATPNTNISIELALTPTQREKLTDIAGLDKDQSVRAAAGLAQGALEDLAAGGLMLSPGTMSRLASTLDDAYDEDALVAAIEKATGRPLNANVPDELANTKLPSLKRRDFIGFRSTKRRRVGATIHSLRPSASSISIAWSFRFH